MDRKTDIKNMDAPGVASGKFAGDTILKGTATYPLPSEQEGNVLKEFTTEAQPKSNLGGKAKH